MMQEKDNYLVLVTTYLNHTPLLTVTSLKFISFRVCDSTLLSFTDKEFSTFSALYSSSSKGNSGLCEATDLYGRNSHHEGAAFTNALQIAENQIKGTAKLYTVYGKRISSFIFSWQVFQVLVLMLSFFFFSSTPILLQNVKKLSTSKDNTGSVCDFRVGRKFTVK